ncbi:MAG: LURP-one-related family protein [Acidobacteriota bacterium]
MKRSKKILMAGQRKNFLIFVLTGIILLLSTGCSTAVYRRPDVSLPLDTSIYYMDQKVWTLGDQFVIRDGRGEPVFYIKGKFFTIGEKLKFYDMAGNELLYIKQRLFSLKRQYRIYRGSRQIAKINKKLFSFKDKFVVDIPGSENYYVRGDFTKHRYSFFRDGRKVAAVSKKWMSISDNYRIEVFRDEDDILILAATVVIDMVSHNEKHRRNIHIGKNH